MTYRIRLGCSFPTGVLAEFCSSLDDSPNFGSGPGSRDWSCSRAELGASGSATEATTVWASCAQRPAASNTTDTAGKTARQNFRNCLDMYPTEMLDLSGIY